MVDEKNNKIAVKTGALYAYIWDQFDNIQWNQFSDDHFFKWSPLPSSDKFFEGKIALDAGCGSGRAIRSMLLLGAKKVCAIDVGEGCIRNATERNQGFCDRLEAKVASVLDIPYPDETFDFVHCDGVLHHTTDPTKGVSELIRVLKPGGKMVIAVYGRGGLMNFAIYTARIFRHLIPFQLTFSLCKFLSKDTVIWYAILDPMYVPIRKNYYEYEIREWLERAGLQNMIRMDSTWGPYSYGRWLKGDGYLKFMADKPF
jgi:Methylase involved in ubiquinone/menaquinone biosynthesis